MILFATDGIAFKNKVCVGDIIFKASTVLVHISIS